MSLPASTETLTNPRLASLGRFLRRALSNPAFMLGLIIVSVVAAAALWPDALAPFGPNERGAVLQEINGEWRAPPFAPNSRYPLGTDDKSRDLLSRIIHGTRPTLSLALVAALVRILLGTTLGAIAMWYPGDGRRLVLALSSASAALPSMLFAFLVISTIGPGRGAAVFILGIGLTGWSAWTLLVHSGIQRIWTEPYMEAATAIGSTTIFKIRHYLVPNLLPIAIPTAAQEVSATLLILAELGFIGVFLGTTRTISLGSLLSGHPPPLTIPEWGGLLAGTRMEIFLHTWLPIAPAAAFAATIFGFNLLAEGLRQVLDIPRQRRRAPVRARFRYFTGILSWVRPARKTRRVIPGTYRPPGRRRARLRRDSWLLRASLIVFTLLIIAGVMWFVNRQFLQPSAVQQQAQENGPAELLASAQTALRLGDFDLAEQRFQAILEQDPNHQEAQDGLRETARIRLLTARYDEASALADAARWEEALPLLQAIAAEQPDYPGVRGLIARGEQAGQVAAAFAEAEDAYEVSDWPTAIDRYQDVRDTDENFQRERVTERLLTSLMQQVSALATAAEGDPTALTQALDLVERAAQLDPLMESVAIQRDVLHSVRDAMDALEQGNLDSAASQLAQAQQLQADLAGGEVDMWLVNTYLRLARTAFEQGENERALVSFDHILDVVFQADTPSAELAIAIQLEMAQVAQRASEFDLALTHYLSALDQLRQLPSASALLERMGRPATRFDLLVQIGEESTGLEDWQTAATVYHQALAERLAVQGSGENPLVTFYLNAGDAATEEGDRQGAAQAYHQAIAAMLGEDVGLVYTVEPGDTLGAIAARFDSTVQAIVEVNRIDNPSQINVGQQLLIPDTATR